MSVYKDLEDVTVRVLLEGNECTIESAEALLKEIQKMQIQGAPDGTYSNTVCPTGTPYTDATWDITRSGKDFTATFIEENSPIVDALGECALSSRRLIEIGFELNPSSASIKSYMAALNEVRYYENQVAITGDPSYGDGLKTYVVKGSTPYKTYNWNIGKIGNQYNITPTTTS